MAQYARVNVVKAVKAKALREDEAQQGYPYRSNGQRNEPTAARLDQLFWVSEDEKKAVLTNEMATQLHKLFSH